MKNYGCIYCGETKDLSESDIIPDALTNARITNKNVCRINHNNKFSDLFESKVIKELSFICNELDIKSRKSNHYQKYKATINIDGIDYDISMSSFTDLFNGRVLKSSDNKYLISSLEKINKIAKDSNKDSNKVDIIDINNIPIEQKVKINLEIYFDMAIFRLIAKIAFEWYCSRNNVSGYHDDFVNIINFIDKGEGNNPVSIIQDEELYKIINSQSNLGSHILFAYQDKQGRIIVVIYLFGIAMYRVNVSNNTPLFCNNNLLYEELRTDSSRECIIKQSLDELQSDYIKALSLFIPKKIMNGLVCMFPKEAPPIDVALYISIDDIISRFKDCNNDTVIPNKKIIKILYENIKSILDGSLIHKKNIKRFVKEHFKENHSEIRLNPNSNNKEDSFLFYILMHIGKRNIKELNDSLLQELVKELFDISYNNEIIITDELEGKIKDEILSTPDYSLFLERGAEIVNRWE